MRNSANPVIKSYVDDLELVIGHTYVFSLSFYFLFLVLLFGGISIFCGQPFMDITLFGMPIQEGWAKAAPGLSFTAIVISGVLAVLFSFLLSFRYIYRLKNIILKDCNAYTYLVVAEQLLARPARRNTQILYYMTYVEALCLHGRFAEALEFVEPFEHHKRLRFLWLYVKLNTAENHEDFLKYSKEYKRKSKLFNLYGLYMKKDYQGVLDYAKKEFDCNTGYNYVYASYYRALANYELGNKHEAFIAASNCFYGSMNLPYLHEKSYKLYKQYKKEVLNVEIEYTLDEFDEKISSEACALMDPSLEYSTDYLSALASEDSAKPDSSVEDSAKPDSSVEDSAKPDSSVEDSAKPDESL